MVLVALLPAAASRLAVHDESGSGTHFALTGNKEVVPNPWFCKHRVVNQQIRFSLTSSLCL